MDWTEWSKDAVKLMFDQDAAWDREFALKKAKCEWDLPAATLTFETDQKKVLATACLVGTTSDTEGSFLWSWANANIPALHGQALEVVRQFGSDNQLGLLTTPAIAGGKPEAMECMCIAGRIQRAVGTHHEKVGDIGLYFTILHFHASRH